LGPATPAPTIVVLLDQIVRVGRSSSNTIDRFFVKNGNDQQAGGGPSGALRRVVPLPPPELSGAVKFTTVVLSLAYDTFGDSGAPQTIPAIVRVLRGSGTVDTLNVEIQVGRKFFHFLHVDDQAASVELHPPAGFRPQVSALVEYATP
jgi:hypothetical protein